MCFRFGSCFGSGSGQDYGRSTSKATHRGGGWADHIDYNGTNQQAYHRQPGADETQGNAHNGGGHATYAQEKANNDTSRHPAAWINKVGHDAGRARLQEDAAADRREHGAVDHHHYPSTITSTTAR
ncbi:unnamed protein product [Alopecurus aequalis]